MSKRTNRAVFPHVDVGHRSISFSEGLSIREYFAAHAPADIPGWFQPPDRPKPDETPLESLSIDDPVREAYLLYLEGDISKPDASLTLEQKKIYRRFLRVSDEFHKRLAAWEAGGPERRYYLWRWYYADMMIATRGT